MRKVILIAFACFVAIFAAAKTTPGRQLYISPSGSDSNDGLSSATPWLTFDKVVGNLVPGDVVNIMPGTYSLIDKPNKHLIDLGKEHSGTKNKYITFRAYDPSDRPKFKAGGYGVWQCVVINASYVIFDGIELEGFNQQLDSLSAFNASQKAKTDKNCDWNDIARYNTGAIDIGGAGKNSAFPTHVIVRNCVVHDFPGGGIGAMQADYVTFENNLVYNNAWFTMYACSAMGILYPFNSDEETGYKIRIIGNTVYNNRTMIKWYRTGKYSDGNGIIIDVNKSPHPDAPDEVKRQGAYKARTLVANNVCYFNGGSGIHSFRSQHVDIINNTAYMNQQKYADEYGDIFSQAGADNHIENNIMYGKPGGWCTNYFPDSGVTYGRNVYYNGVLHGNPTGEFKCADPLFVHAPASPADKADFRLSRNSPAKGYGIILPYMPSRDKAGVRRKGRVDCGAYQVR